MAKEVKALIKLNLQAGQATAAPPAGPALGQQGVPIMDFIRQYNERTAQDKGKIIPVVITVYDDRSFTFVTKLPPASALIKEKLGLKKAATNPGKEVVATMTKQQVTEIAESKMKDLNARTVKQAIRVIEGTARSMGIQIK
ncbi:MAG: 50S ribosomal protein L11 [Candidatus Roizmanbacteria bacterium]|nr:50S ribosomal protein L11 [Candidatus Roizmanbacteria bacterium]